jgi:hypothetical protein
MRFIGVFRIASRREEVKEVEDGDAWTRIADPFWEEMTPTPLVFVRVANKRVTGGSLVRVASKGVKDLHFKRVREGFVIVAKEGVRRACGAGQARANEGDMRQTSGCRSSREMRRLTATNKILF